MNYIYNAFRYIFNFKNNNIFFFLMGCSSLFFSCQILKTSKLIEKSSSNYKNCFNYLTQFLDNNKAIEVCEILNKKENFQNFVYNYFYTILFMYALIREVINKTYFDLKYWIISHIILIGYSLCGNYSLFQFSIESSKNYSDIQIKIIAIVGTLISIFLFRQIYLKKIKYNLIINFLSIYLMMYLLLFSMTNKIKIHLHHALVCGLLSLCFTDFKSIIDKYIHSIMVGITVQGFNMYSLSEIYMFYIDDISAPSFTYLLIIYSFFICFWFSLIFIRYKNYFSNQINNSEINIFNTDESDVSDVNIQMPLLPTKKDIQNYEHNTI